MHEQGTSIQIYQICDKNKENRHETAPLRQQQQQQQQGKRLLLAPDQKKLTLLSKRVPKDATVPIKEEKGVNIFNSIRTTAEIDQKNIHSDA